MNSTAESAVENKLEILQTKYNELISKATINQRILDKFSQFELAMLASTDMVSLLNVFLLQSLEAFDLDDCRLVWKDENHTSLSILAGKEKEIFMSKVVMVGGGVEPDEIFLCGEKPKLGIVDAKECDRSFPGNSLIKSAAYIPLVTNGTIIGSLNFGSTDPERYTKTKATHFMERTGMIAATCLRNISSQEQIKQLSLIDNLTKVKNRRSFDMDTETEVSRAHRNRQPLSCLFIDADYFKRINDTHGHLAGDEALRCMAKWAQSQLRESDHLARYGGEEFAVLLPSCHEELAAEIGERIRGFVESQVIEFEDITIKITLSIGVSTFYPIIGMPIDKADVIKQLLGQADAGVYDAKESGRNRVCYRSFDE